MNVICYLRLHVLHAVVLFDKMECQVHELAHEEVVSLLVLFFLVVPQCPFDLEKGLGLLPRLARPRTFASAPWWRPKVKAAVDVVFGDGD